MRELLPLLALVFVLSLPACADDSSDGAETTSDPPRPAAKAEDAASGQPRVSESPDEKYHEAKGVCGTEAPRQVAKGLGMETDNPLRIAKRYARGYVAKFQRSVFAGCLAGLRGQGQP